METGGEREVVTRRCVWACSSEENCSNVLRRVITTLGVACIACGPAGVLESVGTREKIFSEAEDSCAAVGVTSVLSWPLGQTLIQ